MKRGKVHPTPHFSKNVTLTAARISSHKLTKSPEMDLCLFSHEVEGITGYKRARNQQKHFDTLGVPSQIRPDNTLSVIRAHLLNPPGIRAQNDVPKRVRQVR